MLTATTIKSICSTLKIKEEDLQAAIKDEKEVDVPIPENLHVFTEDEVTQLKNNEYKNGKEKGVEMEIKTAKEKHGLEFSGKTIEGLIAASQKKALDEANVEPDKKVAEIQLQLKAAQETVKTLEVKLTEKDAEVEGVKTTGELLKHIPKGATLAGEKIIGLMKMDGFEFKFEEGKMVAYNNGVKAIDKIGNVVPVNDVVAGYVKENKLAEEEGGAGGGGRGKGDEKPAGGIGKLSDLKKQHEAQGKSCLGEEFSKLVQEAVKADPNFDMNA